VFSYKVCSVAYERVETEAKVVGFEMARFFMSKNALVPRFFFKVENGRQVTSKPIHSWLVEFSTYKVDQTKHVVYDLQNPEKYVVKNSIEVAINFGAVLVATVLVVIVLSQ
jgi:hypothetical protein